MNVTSKYSLVSIAKFNINAFFPQLLGWTMVLWCFLVPIDGFSSTLLGLRAFTFYITIPVIVLLLLSLPALFESIASYFFLVSMSIALIISIIVAFVDSSFPINYLEMQRAIQVVISGYALSIFAHDKKWFNRFSWSFWCGWVLFAIISNWLVISEHPSIITVRLAFTGQRIVVIGGMNASIHGLISGLGVLITLMFMNNIKTLRWRIFLSAFILIGVASLLLTTTRSSILALALAGILWAILPQVNQDRKINISLIITNIILISLVAFVSYLIVVNSTDWRGYFDNVINRFLYGGDSYRLELFEIAREYIMNNPLGIGVARSPYAISMWTSSKTVLVSHNAFMTMFVEAGVIGGLVFLISWISVLWNTFRYYLRTNSRFFLAIFVYLTLVSLFLDTNYYKETWIVVGLCVFVSSYLKQNPLESSRSKVLGLAR